MCSVALGQKFGQQPNKRQVLPANFLDSSSTISWTTVESFSNSNERGRKGCLLSFLRQMLVASRTTQFKHLCGSLYHLLGPPKVAPRDPWFPAWLPHSPLWQTQLSTTAEGQILRRTPSHGLCSRSQHGWVKEKQNHGLYCSWIKTFSFRTMAD